jgi:hypothetical protein
VRNAVWSAAVVIAVTLGLAAPTWAGDLKLEIRDGRVTLDARDVTVRQILAEWARVGRTTVIDGQKVPGGPVTLQLAGVTERQALDVLLRSVAGYIAAPRAQAVPNTSAFDRIVVMPSVRVVATAGTADDANSRFRQGMGGRLPADEQDQMFGPGNPIMPGNPNMPQSYLNYNQSYPSPGEGGRVTGVLQVPAGQAGTQPAAQPVNPNVPWVPQGTAVPGQVAQPAQPTKPKGPGGPGGQ